MRALKLLTCCFVVGAMSMTVLGQEKGPGGDRPARPEGGPGGPGAREPLSAEKSKAAWELQATGVGKRLALKDDQVKAVVKAYTDARTSHQAAAEKLREELANKASEGNKDDKKDNKDAKPDGEKRPPGQGGRGAGFGAEAMKAMEDMNKTEREKLEKALAATLSTEQTTKAVASLGAFTRQWDVMANTIAGFKLEAAKQQTALDAVEDFVVAQGKARVTAEGDREAIRTAMQESREKLADSLKKVLSEEQIKTFDESIRGGGRRGPGGPGGGDRRGGGGGK